MEKMKTSNKILTTFLSIIAIYFLVFALDWRLFGKKKKDSGGTELKHVIPLAEFNHLLLDNVKLEVVCSDSNYIEITYTNDTTDFYYMHDSSFYKFEPRYIGDSISLDNFPRVHANNSALRLLHGCISFTDRPLKSVAAIDSRVELSRFNSDSLNITLNNSSLNGLGESSFRKLNINAHSNSKVNGNNKFSVDTLNISLENSRANFNKPIQQLSATVLNKSNLNLAQVDDIRIKKEKGSKVYFR
jgi:hypothetical protein